VKIGLILLKIAVSAYGIPLPIAGALEALSEYASNVLIDTALMDVGGEADKDLINQTVTKVKSKLTDSSQTFISDEVDIHAFNNNDQHSAEETKQAYNEVLNLFQSQLKMF
jgi:dienelactone hydrolase